MNKLIYTTSQIEEIAALAAQKAVSSVLNLENVINCLNLEGDEMKERRNVLIGRNEDGSPLYKMLNADSQDEMNLKIAQFMIETGRVNVKSVPLLKDFAEEWMQRKRKLKPTTVVNYRKYLDEYIVPTLGNKRLDKITSLDVQKLLDKHKDLARSTLKNTKEILSQIMKYAINDELIVKNPCSDIDIEIPSDKKTVRQPLSISDYRDILNNLDKLCNTDKRFIGLCMYTAMRRGEVLGLKWDDIYDGYIHVVRNVTHPQQNSPVISTPKTKAGIRTIPIVPQLSLILSKKEEGFIIGGECPISLSSYRNMWERINKTIDMHGATPHILRHSYLTYAVGETTDFKTIQGISGHADLSTLLNTYAHPQEEKVRKLSQKMSDLFK